MYCAPHEVGKDQPTEQFDTKLTLATVRTNTGKSAIVANLLDGREIWLGESDCQGSKRALIEFRRNVDEPTKKKISYLEAADEVFLMDNLDRQIGA